MASIDEFIDGCIAIADEEIIQTLAYLGEQCVKRIRDRSAKESWYDQTGNLRSSIGYIILDDGNTIVDFGFDSSFGKPERKTKVEFITKDGKTVSFTATQPGGGQEGARKGQEYAKTLISQYSDGYALIVVAGMEYAEYVEAMENKDVLASTELWARNMMNEHIEKTRIKIERRIAKLQNQLGL